MTAPANTARERLEIMIRTGAGSMTVWHLAQVRAALDAYRAEVLREAVAALDGRIIADQAGTPTAQEGRVHGLCAAVGVLRRMAEG